MKEKKPVCKRWWYLALAALIGLSGLTLLVEDPAAAVFGLAICAAMFAVTAVRNKKEKEEAQKKLDELHRQADERQAESRFAESSPNLTPETVNGLSRSYHYKDVEILIDWRMQNGLNVKRGDKLDLAPNPRDDDPENVYVYCSGVFIGRMKANRMRNMVIDWKNNGSPVLAYVNGVFVHHPLLIEIAFYGRPKK